MSSVRGCPKLEESARDSLEQGGTRREQFRKKERIMQKSRHSLAKIASGLLIGLLALLVIGAGGYAIYALRTPLPQHDTALRLDGLSAPVEILRDEWGVPHIYAAIAEDLFFAQGYTHAQDRWWQMEWSRRAAQGRLGELVGRQVLGTDIQLRALGLRHVAEQELALYDAQTLSYLQAFADGVNVYLASRTPGALALEYRALGLAGMDVVVEQWTLVDTLAYGKYVSIGLSANYGLEQMLAELSDALPPQMVADFLPNYPYDAKPTVLREDEVATAVGVSEATAVPAPSLSLPKFDWQPPYPGLGSNNWVVDGRFTASGKPLLANDPHLLIEMPSIWYEIGLHCQPLGDACPFDVVGFTFTPFPGVALGHNQAIAWGATVAGPDVQDLYQMRVNAADPYRYAWDQGVRAMEVRDEHFTFADGSPPLTLPMRVTHLGPIINDYAIDPALGTVGPLSDEPLALRWTALEPGVFFNAIFGLDRATNWEEFRAALRDWDFGSMNLVYADVAGNIGYQMPGRVPIRAAGHDGLTPAPGWTSDYAWQGTIPYELLPHLYNPERGYIVTANQEIVPPEYWNYLARELGHGRHYDFHTGHFIFGYRAERIETLLLAQRDHTVESFTAIQADNKLIAAEEMMPHLARLTFDTVELNNARDWLQTWDFQMTRDSGQAAFYAIFWRALLDNLYNDDLSAHDLLPAVSVHMWPTTRLLAEPENMWWDDVRTPDVVETRDTVLRKTFAEAYETAVSTLGPARDTWRWGDLHTATFKSLPLGEVSPLDRVVNRGPLPVDGGANTINATGWSEQPDDYFAVQGLPSMRMVVDLANLSRSVNMHTTGQSGHPASPHYDDMLQPWAEVTFKPMRWTRAQVEQAAAERLVLRPANP